LCTIRWSVVWLLTSIRTIIHTQLLFLFFILFIYGTRRKDEEKSKNRLIIIYRNIL
jgi:hypothetical protein